MSVYKNDKSPFYWYDFQVGGVRHYGSTKTGSLKEARAEELRLKKEARDQLARDSGLAPLTIQNAVMRYWNEVGIKHAGSGDTLRNLQQLQLFFGAEKLLADIVDTDAAALVAWRSAQPIANRKPKEGEELKLVEPATVNRSCIDVIKKLFNRAKRTWKYNFPKEPNWNDFRLKEPVERVRELDTPEAERLDDEVRDDYADWFEFARTCGSRLDETIIRWADVNEAAGLIIRFGKNDEPVRTVITDDIQAILDRCKGHHPEWVFTYVSKRPRGDQKKGQRYPITYEGAKTQWRRLRGRAKVKNFRLHDLRHDTATKLLRETGNLKLVQKVLNHRSITTTAKYAHAFDKDVREAMEAVAKSRKSPGLKKKKGSK